MSSHAEIRLVLSDIDGTLLRRGETLPQAFSETVEALSQKGIGFTFASGRLPYMIAPLAEKLNVHAPVCACNGTCLYQGEKIIERHPFCPERLRPMAEAAMSLGMTVLYALDGVEYCMRETEASERKRQERGAYHPIRPLAEAEWETLRLDKLNILDEAERGALLLPYEDGLSGAFELTHYGRQGVEIVSAGYGKAYGLRRICERLSIPPCAVLAIGDNENDNEMLKLAGIGAAVGNAEPETKACADIVAEQEAAAGVLELIRKLCFS